MSVLKNLTIAVTGTLPAETSQVKKWIEANGGRYSPQIRKGVTHVITGKDAWKAATDGVQAARDAGAFIVSYDWLEDSLQKRRKLAEQKYTWEYLWKKRKRRKELERLGRVYDAKKFNAGCEEVKKATGTGTSKSRPRASTRKPRVSKSCLIGDMVQPFVSAADDLKRRREEREAAKAKKAELAAAKKMEKANTTHATSPTSLQAQSSTSNAADLSPSSHALSTASSQSISPTHGPQAKKLSLKDLYHYYLDTTGFEYKITLTRCNMRLNEITRYRLSILESHTKPHVYCTFVEFFPTGGGANLSKEAAESAIIQAVFDFNTTFREDLEQVVDTSTVLACSANKSVEADAIQTVHSHPQAAHLRALLNPTAPAEDKPYRSLLAPMNSPFDTAWRTFRHAFRDLTLLSWEERLDTSKTLYKMRASHFGIEPFVYVRPKDGMPLGLRTQEAGLFVNQTLARVDREGRIITTSSVEAAAEAVDMMRVGKRKGADEKEEVDANDDDYTHNAFALPSLTHPLGNGVIGTALAQDAAAIAKQQRLMQQQQQQQQQALSDQTRQQNPGLSAGRGTSAKKPNFNKPLFNGVTGRPRTDAWGRYKNPGGGAGASVTQARKLFPSERRGL